LLVLLNIGSYFCYYYESRYLLTLTSGISIIIFTNTGVRNIIDRLLTLQDFTVLPT